MRDDRAQMMLMTAFVLVIGFVALTGMVARVTQLPEQTANAGDRPIYIEAAAVANGVEQIMEDLNNLYPVRADGTNMEDYEQAVNDALEHMVILESARGYRLRLDTANPPACTVVADADPDTGGNQPGAQMTATFSLADTETSITFTITYTVYDAWSQTDPADDGDPELWTDGELDPAADALVTSCTTP